MKAILFALLSVFTLTLAQAQDINLSGTVKAEASGQNLSYVNIGIRKKNIGTASDEQGRFILKLPQQHLQDTLTFSAIGYQQLSVPVRELVKKKPLQIKLSEKTMALQEVVVKSHKMKIRKLGVTGRLPGVWGVPDKKESKDVFEFANFIEVKNKPAEVLSAHFYLASTVLDSAIFRINFYKNNSGSPGERLVEKNIIQKVSTKDGWLTLDLTKYDLYLTEDFFIGVEYLPEQDEHRQAIALGGKIGGSVFSKQSSFGEWKKISGVSLSSYVTARQ
ncbi:carboxypeptidase-like regulatory domain-containing protein [Pontibacter cellulosilyticus]|uniref:Carboxypeptidase-like regulatory domain-containing protein n=1 Tax=Pontibacter cellulosilyticus TaxID=1720253 RepID=A0A923N7X2_9BACT|nr:carboxypeptidase-like regulatory domain-containing protein [Pontibacter cellulosilyticus]MBC5993417.1 carboxypeptidase-like regulatory domain-containing protein [Pontibacter cellulosilyticus]